VISDSEVPPLIPFAVGLDKAPRVCLYAVLPVRNDLFFLRAGMERCLSVDPFYFDRPFQNALAKKTPPVNLP